MPKPYELSEEETHEYFNSGNLEDSPVPGMGDNSGLDEESALDGLNELDMLREARKALIKRLYGLMMSGQATPADLNNLRQLLKDNGMVMGDPMEGARDGNTAEARTPRELPSFTTPDYDRR